MRCQKQSSGNKVAAMDLCNRTEMSEMKQREFSIMTLDGNWVVDCVVGGDQGTVWQVPMVSSLGVSLGA